METTLSRTSAHTIEVLPDGSISRCTSIEARESVLRPLMDDLFLQHWSKIIVGPCLEGAVFEVRFEKPPAVRYSDGYLTVDLGYWHFHLCVGPTRSSASAELREKRPIARAVMFETRGQGCGHGQSWGLRFWNGYGEQMATVFLPSPFVTDDQKMLKRNEADWSRLALYYELRQALFGEPVPADYQEAANAAWPETAA